MKRPIYLNEIFLMILGIAAIIIDLSYKYPIVTSQNAPIHYDHMTQTLLKKEKQGNNALHALLQHEESISANTLENHTLEQKLRHNLHIIKDAEVVWKTSNNLLDALPAGAKKLEILTDKLQSNTIETIAIHAAKTLGEELGLGKDVIATLMQDAKEGTLPNENLAMKNIKVATTTPCTLNALHLKSKIIWPKNGHLVVVKLLDDTMRHINTELNTQKHDKRDITEETQDLIKLDFINAGLSLSDAKKFLETLHRHA